MKKALIYLFLLSILFNFGAAYSGINYSVGCTDLSVSPGSSVEYSFYVCDEGGIYYFSNNCDKGYTTYNLSYPINYLTEKKCIFNLSDEGKLLSLNWNNSQIVSNSGWSYGTYKDFDNFLNINHFETNKNLYPKVVLNFSLFNEISLIKSKTVSVNLNRSNLDLNSLETISELKYFAQQYSDLYSDYGEKKINISSILTNDTKCDFNQNGVSDYDVLNLNLFELTFITDGDGDGVTDDVDKCRDTPWNDTNGHTANDGTTFNGCPYEYTLDSYCPIFNKEISEFSVNVRTEDGFDTGVPFGTGVYDYYTYETIVVPTSTTETLPSDDPFPPIRSEGSSDTSYTISTLVSSCDLKYNGNDCFVGSFRIYDGSSDNSFFERKFGGPDSKCPTTAPLGFSCNNQILTGSVDPTLVFEPRKMSKTCIDIPIKLLDISDEEYEFEEDNDDNKIKCSNDNSCIFKKTGENFTMPVILRNITENFDYTLIDNGIEKKQNISPEVVALVSHKIKRFRDAVDVQNLMYKSISLVKSMDIIKSVDYDLTNNETKIKLKLNPSPGQKDINIYQVLPKYMVDSLSNINVTNSSNGQFFVKDKDPVIGWYFNETTGDEEVEYIIPGDSEGGVIILTQDPILFNEGELVVNYREAGCNGDEAFLFEIDSLDSSNLYLPNSAKTYKVCVAHVSENLYADNTHANVLDLFDFENGANLSLNKVLTNQVSISTDNTSIYWGMLVQEENPDGTFSCLGSIDDGNSSKFGDCAYNPQKRIWLHLGADLYSPTTEISYPYLAHNMKVVLTAKDNAGGSGIANITYQIDSNTPITKTFTDNSTEEKLDFQETCSNDWGCTKNIKYFSCDLQGNCEDEKTFELNIIDKGTSCTAECLAKPSPNRFVKECRNINGCTFYPINNESINDDGKYVAEKCDLATKGTWVKYDNYHDILCPNGPIKKSIFSSEPINIHMSECDQVIKTPYPVIINGEQLIMNVVSCFNYN